MVSHDRPSCFPLLGIPLFHLQHSTALDTDGQNDIRVESRGHNVSQLAHPFDRLAFGAELRSDALGEDGVS